AAAPGRDRPVAPGGVPPECPTRGTPVRARLQRRPGRSTLRAVRRRPWVVLLLVLGLGGLRALASATLPDPVWVPGLYDDADYDDVVLAVLDLDGSCSDAPPVLTPSTRVVARVL